MLRFERPKNCYGDEIEHQRRNFYNGRSRNVEDNLYYRRERSHRCKDDNMYCRKVDHIFECHNYTEEKKIKLVVVEFIDYASVW